MADRDPEAIKQDIDRARDQLAATVDTLTDRAHPRRIAADLQVAAVKFVKKPAVHVHPDRCRLADGGAGDPQDP